MENICGIDIGSSFITCVTGKKDNTDNTIEILSGSKVNCRGINKCLVVNINETSNSIQCAIEDTKININEISKVYIGIRGSHIDVINNEGMIDLLYPDRGITDKEILKVIEKVKDIGMSPDRQILNIIEKEYRIDKRDYVINPLGKKGKCLEVFVYIVTGLISHIKNIESAVKLANLEIEKLVYGIFGLGDTITGQKEKEEGCLVLDFNGQIIDILVYYGGIIEYVKELQVGGMINMSEILKTEKEFFEEVGILPKKIIVTGDINSLDEVKRTLKKIFRPISVRLGLLKNIEGPKDIISNPVFTPAISLLKTKRGVEFIW